LGLHCYAVSGTHSDELVLEPPLKNRGSVYETSAVLKGSSLTLNGYLQNTC